MKTAFFAILVVFLTVSGCVTQSGGRNPSGHQVQVSEGVLTPDERSRFLQLVNAARSREGVSPVRYDPNLNRAARGHSIDMEKRDYFSHRAPRPAPSGVTIADRVTDAGYQWKAVGENIAMGPGSVDEAFRMWMDSPGHRANILKISFAEMGLGRSGAYWTQIFGTKR